MEDNPWLARRVLNIAHQGGEREAPSNTLYAFKTAVAKGAHMLELDVHATADGELVVCHDDTVDRTTDGSGSIDAMSVEQVRALDAAHRFAPGAGAARDAPSYPFRGVATGAAEPPAGFDDDDFKIPTLRQVLSGLPEVFVNIDIKRSDPDTVAYEQTVAALIEELGCAHRVMVASFADAVLRRVRAMARLHTSAATEETIAFWSGGEPGDYQALQVPADYAGVTVVTPDLVSRAHDAGVAVHVWTINEPGQMRALIDMGVDGIVTDEPTVLAGVLA